MFTSMTVAMSLMVIPSHATGGATQSVPDDVIISLERTACYGTCPVYKVTIDAQGTVSFDGTDHVRVKGHQTDRIPASAVARLLATAERIRFFELRDSYRTVRHADGSEEMVTDLPTAFVSITRGGRTKRIEDYFGTPADLRQLERDIDLASNTKRWIFIDEATLQQMVRDSKPPSADERADLLQQALQRDDTAIVRGLLELGADPNGIYFGTNTTPLIMARSEAAVKVLLDAGANPNLKNEYGNSALHSATRFAPGAAIALIKAGARIDEANLGGMTPLGEGACWGNAGVVEALLNAGANPGTAAGGMSALECARRGKTERGADRGDQAVQRDFDRVISLLTQALAKPRK
jgi:hypothetical protein